MGYYPEYTAVQTIDALADAGFTHSEWSVNCTEKLFAENPGTPEQLGAMIAEHGRLHGPKLISAETAESV